VSIEADAVYTDDASIYRDFPAGYAHEKVNHSRKEYVRGNVHTGTIDGYWGLLKRGVIGSFHRVSIKHLHRYLAEFQYKWNNREAQDMFTARDRTTIDSERPGVQALTGRETSDEPF